MKVTNNQNANYIKLTTSVEENGYANSISEIKSIKNSTPTVPSKASIPPIPKPRKSVQKKIMADIQAIRVEQNSTINKIELNRINFSKRNKLEMGENEYQKEKGEFLNKNSECIDWMYNLYTTEIALIEKYKKASINDKSAETKKEIASLEKRESKIPQDLKKIILQGRSKYGLNKFHLDADITPNMECSYKTIYSENDRIKDIYSIKDIDRPKTSRKNMNNYAKECGAIVIKIPKQSTGALHDAIFLTDIGGGCHALSEQNIIECSQGRTIADAILLNGKLIMSEVNKIITRQNKFHACYLESIDKGDKLEEERLLEHNLIKNGAFVHSTKKIRLSLNNFEYKIDKKSRREFVSGLIESITSNNENKNIYNMVSLFETEDDIGHSISINNIYNQENAKITIFWDPNHDLFIFDNQEKFKSYFSNLLLDNCYDPNNNKYDFSYERYKNYDVTFTKSYLHKQ
ncbi:hypothetical protein [Candidatus Williamhamiltonella defendens]|uniref:Uncharacterized protein n=1 Tax=Candidatus Hamiltonella defensa (Bemisia tabaci) TaxID=672795 RepID=A0A249DW43_9ENTR|nr:hypothetical protein [Candidatus Hamiltonella defensa]ASX25773.1 hypothetical protein BA171_00985 [Candidatus Hamiltonella defensa (Bemisia tabaci)]CED78708.1 Protein of unknown function [Candidatus Hamiltonella defensa (Bemisia tabaci)]